MSTASSKETGKCNWWVWRCDDTQAVSRVQERFSGLVGEAAIGRKRPQASKDYVKYIKNGLVFRKGTALNWRALWEFLKRSFVGALVDLCMYTRVRTQYVGVRAERHVVMLCVLVAPCIGADS